MKKSKGRRKQRHTTGLRIGRKSVSPSPYSPNYYSPPLKLWCPIWAQMLIWGKVGYVASWTLHFQYCPISRTLKKCLLSHHSSSILHIVFRFTTQIDSVERTAGIWGSRGGWGTMITPDEEEDDSVPRGQGSLRPVPLESSFQVA